jgi:hypothetical protein
MDFFHNPMLENIKTNLNGETVLLDTSLVSAGSSEGDGDILRILYGGIHDLRFIPIEAIDQRVLALNELAEICSSHRIYVTKEVEQELNEGLDQLNGHVSFLKGRKRAFRKHIDKRRNRWHSENDDRIGRLDDYSNALYAFVHQLRYDDPEHDFDEQDKRLYGLFLREAENRSKDLQKRKRAQRERKMDNPLLLGEELQTDAKIVATAYVLSYRGDVTIITNDIGIHTLSRRIGDSFSELRKTCLARKLNEPPPSTIRVLFSDMVTEQFKKRSNAGPEVYSPMISLARAMYPEVDFENDRY